MKRQGRSLFKRVFPESTDYSSEVAAVIGAGGVAAIPTETSYGLAVDPHNQKALERLFSLKNRPPAKPVLVLIKNSGFLSRLVSHTPANYIPLIKLYWTGPLTLIFPALPDLPKLLTAGTGTIGIRVSSNRIATEICRKAGGAITATSANLSGHAPARSADEVIDIFKDAIDIVVDGPVLSTAPCSTIVGRKDDQLTLIRKGMIPFEKLRSLY